MGWDGRTSIELGINEKHRGMKFIPRFFQHYKVGQGNPASTLPKGLDLHAAEQQLMNA